MKRSERIKAEHFFLRLWDDAVGKPGYDKREWSQVVTAIWSDASLDEIDCELDPRTKKE